MKIGQTQEHSNAASVAGDKTWAATTATVSSTASADEASAKVALSTTATSLIGTNDSNADFDADKVATISHAIDTGSYKVNAQTIADKLLTNARELLTKAQ